MMDSVEIVQGYLARIRWTDMMLFVGWLAALVLLVKGVQLTIHAAADRFPRWRMRWLAWLPLASFLMYFIGSLAAVYELIKPGKEVFISAVVTGMFALGLAVRETLASIVAGIILLIDKPFQVGDRITFQDSFCGEVLDITLRSVKVLTPEHKLISIPNNKFLSEAVTSNSLGELGMVARVDIHLPPSTDIGKAAKLLRRLAEKNPLADPHHEVSVSAEELADGSSANVGMTMHVECFIKDARAEKNFQTDYLIAADKELRRYGLRPSG